jgi:hypothetical protein
MTCRTLQANGQQWRFCPDDPPAEAARLQRIAFAVVVDDLLLTAPPVPIDVSSTRPDFAGRSGPDGRVGVVGRPFPALPPAQAPGTVIGMTLAAAGYVPLSLSASLGPQPLYPDGFVPLDFGTRRLVRGAVSIWGRVRRVVGGVLQPVAGANVAVTAATPVPALAGALPAPPSAASFLALAAPTDATGNYRLGPVARAVRLTLTASDGASSAMAALDLDYAQPVNLLDFILP